MYTSPSHHQALSTDPRILKLIPEQGFVHSSAITRILSRTLIQLVTDAIFIFCGTFHSLNEMSLYHSMKCHYITSLNVQLENA